MCGQILGGKQDSESGAAAGEARLDGAEVGVEDLGDLLVGEVFDLAEDDDGAVGLGQLAEGGLDAKTELGLGGVVEGRTGAVGEGGSEGEGLAGGVGLVGLGGGVDADLLAFVAGLPAALVGGLVQGDAVEPGAQAGVAVELANAAEDLDEDFLGDVGGVGGVVEAAADEGVEGLMVLGDEQAEGLFGAGFEVGDERCLFGSNAYRAC